MTTTSPALTISAAIELACELAASAPHGVTVRVETYAGRAAVRGADGRYSWQAQTLGRLVMEGGSRGRHSLELSATNEERARAHVAGYVEAACREVNREAAPAGKLAVTPMTISAAKVYIQTHHRHHRPPVSGLFAVGVRKDGELVGVLIVGRPVARMTAQDPHTVEATRCATDGSKNAVSMLYSAAWRAARALGYRKLITYTLPEEGGASMRACGFVCVGEAGGGSWSRKGRERIDMHPTQRKLRWEATSDKAIARAEAG
jgi:hypothetical protein